MLFRIRRPGDSASLAAEEEQDAPQAVAHGRDAAPPAQSTRDPIPLRGVKQQSTSTDARAERLVLGVRAEIEELRARVNSRPAIDPGLYLLDLDAVLSDPSRLDGVPSGAILRLLLGLRDRAESAEARLESDEQELAALRAHNAELRMDLAVARSRHEVLGDVIAALHNNLDDLRHAARQRRIEADDQPRLLPPA